MSSEYMGGEIRQRFRAVLHDEALRAGPDSPSRQRSYEPASLRSEAEVGERVCLVT
jgi:hypothetical protein